MEGLRSRDGPQPSPGAAGSSNPEDSRSASGVSVCPLCWAISTRGTTVLVHGSSALPMCGMNFDPGMDPYLPRVVLVL